MSAHTLAFACAWDRSDPPSTWSFTPWHLREALTRRWSIRDIDPAPHVALEVLAKLRYARIESGRVRSTWPQTSNALNAYERKLRSLAANDTIDAVLQMSDYGRVTGTPYFLYQDLSRHLILQRFSGGTDLPGEFNGMSLKLLAEGAKRQNEIYQGAAAVFCMSEWLRSDLLNCGIDPARVVVVPPGINVTGDPVGNARISGSRSRLLIVGTEPIRKGLLDVLAALPMVREQIKDARLTVVGPAKWPIDGDPPRGVDFLGKLSRRRVAEVLAQSDLMVMPSKWEGFGMAFAESLVAGVPCVARNDCAMPEIIDPPRYGRVVGGPGLTASPAELAEAVVGALQDDALYERVQADRRLLARRFSWETAAETMTSAIRKEIV